MCRKQQASRDDGPNRTTSFLRPVSWLVYSSANERKKRGGWAAGTRGVVHLPTRRQLGGRGIFAVAGERSGPRCRLLPSFSRKGRQGKGKGQPIPCLLRCSAAPPPYLILWFLDTGLQAPAAAAPATKGGGLLPSYIISYIYTRRRRRCVARLRSGGCLPVP